MTMDTAERLCRSLFHRPRPRKDGEYRTLSPQIVATRMARILALLPPRSVPDGLMDCVHHIAASPSASWRALDGHHGPLALILRNTDAGIRSPVLNCLVSKLLFDIPRPPSKARDVPCFYCERAAVATLHPRCAFSALRSGPGRSYVFLCDRHAPGGKTHQRLRRIGRWAANYPPHIYRPGFPPPPPRYDRLLEAREDIELELRLSGDWKLTGANARQPRKPGLKTEQMWRKDTPPESGLDWFTEMSIRAAAWAEIEARYNAATRASRIVGGKKSGILGGRPRNEDSRAVQQAKKMIRAGKSLRATAAAVGMSAPTLSRRLRAK